MPTCWKKHVACDKASGANNHKVSLVTWGVAPKSTISFQDLYVLKLFQSGWEEWLINNNKDYDDDDDDDDDEEEEEEEEEDEKEEDGDAAADDDDNDDNDDDDDDDDNDGHDKKHLNDDKEPNRTLSYSTSVAAFAELITTRRWSKPQSQGWSLPSGLGASTA